MKMVIQTPTFHFELFLLFSIDAEDKVWSTSSWQVMPQMPRWSKEASHAVRSWRVSPPGANGGVMLQRMGIGAVNTKGSKGLR